MTGIIARIREPHARWKQRKRQIAARYKRAAIKTFCEIEIGFVKAAQAGGNLDCLTAKVRALMRIPSAQPCLPLMARHFRLGGVKDVTADQLADQIIAAMRAVAETRTLAIEESNGDHAASPAAAASTQPFRSQQETPV